MRLRSPVRSIPEPPADDRATQAVEAGRAVLRAEHPTAQPKSSAHVSRETPKAERFVMCPPEFLSTKVKNNVFMSGEPIDKARAMQQYRRIRNVINAFGVDVLEIPPKDGLQDQTYVANIGVAIPPYIVLANYKAPGRSGEVAPAKKFFEGLGYQCIQPPYDFEGEADCKLLMPGVYIGGYGQFSDRKAFEWIQEKTGAHIIPVEEVSAQQYHLDCSVFVVDGQNVLCTTKGLSPESVKRLELYANVIPTPSGIETTGITNGVTIPEKKIYLSGTMVPESSAYRKAMEWLDSTFDRWGYTVVKLDTDEGDKSGADLSCMIFHLTF